jgi:hypothetical protein
VHVGYKIGEKEPNMPMQGELSIPGTPRSWNAPKAGFRARHIVRRHAVSDLAVVIIFSAIGLLAAIALTWLFPLSNEISAAMS